MILLGIETSCDETSAAIIEGGNNGVILKSNVIASSLLTHGKTGGIIPENAAREQIKYIIPVIDEALNQAGIKLSEIDAIALTYGPGLIGSLLVGVETAKTISMVFNKPVIPVNHMIGHIYANFINGNPKPEIRNPKLNPNIEFPAIALVVSGGHTDLLLMQDHGEYELLGGTRDDAAGEAFDKIGRMLGFSYPAGPSIEKAALDGNPKRFHFPRPMIGSSDFDFSFSGLKSAVLRQTQSIKRLDKQTINDLSYASQDAIVDVIVKKTMKAAEKYSVKSLLLSGGVAANQSLRDLFRVQSSKFKVKFFAPAKNLCTDNAAMVATAGFFNFNPLPWDNITADPELYFE
jgi:N6-L-threonylcarbamoyladenine synthase